jgi:protein-disulfide isomerase-like protein with CxxC motif
MVQAAYAAVGHGPPSPLSAWCFGTTPMQTFLDTITLAKEKMMAA